MHRISKMVHPGPPFVEGLEHGGRVEADRPVLLIDPPSSTGISRLPPAPEAAEPEMAVLPGNFEVTDSSIPESVAT